MLCLSPVIFLAQCKKLLEEGQAVDNELAKEVLLERLASPEVTHHGKVVIAQSLG